MCDLVQKDDTLMAVYPKIRGVPDQRKKEVYKRELSKIVDANRDVDDARKYCDKKN